MLGHLAISECNISVYHSYKGYVIKLFISQVGVQSWTRCYAAVAEGEICFEVVDFWVDLKCFTAWGDFFLPKPFKWMGQLKREWPSMLFLILQFQAYL